MQQPKKEEKDIKQVIILRKDLNITACAVGPASSEKIDPITGKLTLL